MHHASFLIIDSYFMIPAVIAKVFNPTAGLVIAIVMLTNKVDAETETKPVTVKVKISKCLT